MSENQEITGMQLWNGADNGVDACRTLFDGNAPVEVYVDGEPYVPLRPFCVALGIDPKDQRKKLRGDPRFTFMDIIAIGADGRKRKMAAIPTQEVCAWLFSIGTQRVKPEVRQKLIDYQEMVTKGIHEYTTKGFALNPRVVGGQEYGDTRAQVDALLAEFAVAMVKVNSVLAETNQLGSHEQEAGRPQ